MVFVQPCLENALEAFLEPLTACFGQENIIIYSYFLFFLLFLLCQPEIGRRLNQKAVEHQPKFGRTSTEKGFNINQKQVDWGFGFWQKDEKNPAKTQKARENGGLLKFHGVKIGMKSA